MRLNAVCRLMEFNRYKNHTLENNIVYESLDISKETLKLY